MKKPNGKFFFKYLSIRNAVFMFTPNKDVGEMIKRTNELFVEMMRTGQSVLHTKAGDLVFKKGN